MKNEPDLWVVASSRDIELRRRQILVHSFIYYRLGMSIVSDEMFDRWAKELVDLQEQYPDISKETDFYEDFKGFDGTTGYHLPYYDWVEQKAYSLLRYKEKTGL